MLLKAFIWYFTPTRSSWIFILASVIAHVSVKSFLCLSFRSAKYFIMFMPSHSLIPHRCFPVFILPCSATLSLSRDSVPIIFPQPPLHLLKSHFFPSVTFHHIRMDSLPQDFSLYRGSKSFLHLTFGVATTHFLFFFLFIQLPYSLQLNLNDVS